MLTTQDKLLISRLIKKYAGNISTDAIIAFVADTSGMLAVCKDLVTSNNRDDQQTIGWVDEQCHNQNVDVRGFLYEVEQIVTIFQPDKKNNSNYDLLGLEEGATDDEVKQAYRKLSRKYHPDTASEGVDKNSEKFVQLTKAYHALLDGEHEFLQPTVSPVPKKHWRAEKKSEISGRQKKRNVLWFSLLALVLILASLVIAGRYNNRVMLAGLQSGQTAFIPPETVTGAKEVTQEEKEKQVQETIPEREPAIEPEQIVEVTVSKPEEIVIDEVEVISKPVMTPVQVVNEKISDPIPDESIVESKIQAIEVKKNIEVEKPKEVVADAKVTRPPKKAKEPVAAPSKIEQPKIVSTKKSQPVLVTVKEVAPTPEELQAIIQKKIKQFLTAYTESYKNKDLLTFSHLFDTRATENGKPLVEILPTYSELFQKSDTILLSITLLKWNYEQKDIRMYGRFRIKIQYKTGDTVQGQGRISFLLNEGRDTFEILELEYHFDK